LRSSEPFGTMAPVLPSPDRDPADVVVLDGGPLDGREHRVRSDPEELCVVMTDGQQHRYLRTERIQELPDGRSVPVFEYGGRSYGPG